MKCCLKCLNFIEAWNIPFSLNMNPWNVILHNTQKFSSHPRLNCDFKKGQVLFSILQIILQLSCGLLVQITPWLSSISRKLLRWIERVTYWRNSCTKISTPLSSTLCSSVYPYVLWSYRLGKIECHFLRKFQLLSKNCIGPIYHLMLPWMLFV